MMVLGALATALALFATEVDRTKLGPTEKEPSRILAAQIAAQPIPGGTYVADLVVVAMAPPPGSRGANGPHHDGMSLREMRSADLSGQTTLPLLAGHF